jgi:transposase
MPARIEVSEAERLTLQELSRNHPFPDFRRHALGVLALVNGHRPKVVADILRVTAQSVYNWEKRWQTLGLMGLLNGHTGGRPPKLTAELLDQDNVVANNVCANI